MPVICIPEDVLKRVSKAGIWTIIAHGLDSGGAVWLTVIMRLTGNTVILNRDLVINSRVSLPRDT